MDEKDVSGIAGAVAKELAKLNVDTAEKRSDNKDNESEDKAFNCPECGSPVKARDPYCPQCGCELEWGD